MTTDILTEVWKPIKGYEGLYEVSDQGRVRSKRTGCKNTYDNGYGWLIVELYKDSKGKKAPGKSARGAKRVKLHRLVAEHFIPNPDDHHFVIHIDGNKKNCKASNLRWSANNQGGKS